MLGALKSRIEDKASENLVIGVSKSLADGLFNPRSFLWFLLSNLWNKGPVGALKVRFFVGNKFFFE